MIKRASFVVLLVFLISLPACSGGEDEFEQAGRAFVELLADGEFGEAFDTFDETMSEQISEEKLEEIWDDLLDKTGDFQEQLSTRRETYQQYEIVFVTCRFENGKLDVKVVYNQSKEVSGLFFVPSG